MDIKDLNRLPAGPRTKSNSLVIGRDRIERALISYFDAEPQITEFHQPGISVPVPSEDGIMSLEIDFEVKYATGNCTDWIHVVKDSDDVALPKCTEGIPKIPGLAALVVIRIDTSGIRFVGPGAWKAGA